MNRHIKDLALALSYVTCFRLIRISYVEDTALSGLSKYLPSAGILIGLFLCLVVQITAGLGDNKLLMATVVAVSWLWLTGGLHLDGLMDTADGIFSHQSRERILEIMHDSRVGNFGVLAGVSILLIKIASLASLPHHALLVAVLSIPAWARWCETYAIGRFAYAREQGKGKIWHQTTSYPGDLIRAALPILLVSGALLFKGDPLTVLLPVVLTIGAGLISAHWLNRKIGGHTGDTYGAVVELAETFGLGLTAILAPYLIPY